MTQQTIRLWEMASNQALSEVTSTEIPLEGRLEDWLESDISMLAPDLLVIGRQVRTAFGGLIDLLCIDKVGDAVAIELKKGRTPREVTAQTLDYASWVKDLSPDELAKIAEDYLNSRGLLVHRRKPFRAGSIANCRKRSTRTIARSSWQKRSMRARRESSTTLRV